MKPLWRGGEGDHSPYVPIQPCAGLLFIKAEPQKEWKDDAKEHEVEQQGKKETRICQLWIEGGPVKNTVEVGHDLLGFRELQELLDILTETGWGLEHCLKSEAHDD